MRINQVPSCCGAAIIHDLNSYPVKLGFEEALKQKVATNSVLYSQFTIILSQQQEAAFGKVVRKLGFVPVSVITNNRSGNLLHTYMLSVLARFTKHANGKIASLEKDFVVQPVVRNSLSENQKTDIRRKVQDLKNSLEILERSYASK